MLLGVIADTHDEYDVTRLCVSELQKRGAQAIVHCGDITTPAILKICASLPTWFVFGNHDSDCVPALQEAARAHRLTCLEWGGCFEVASKLIAVTHGHMTSDLRPLLQKKPDYLFTGHFHDPADWMEGPTRRICPGALHRVETPTACLLNLENDALQLLRIDDSG